MSFEDRYSRQILFEGIGAEGQRQLAASRVVIVGCGATGSAVAALLARSGVGTLRIIDRDYVEPSNLQRQTLFDESDAADSLPVVIINNAMAEFNGLNMSLGNLSRLSRAKTRSISAENFTGEKGKAGRATQGTGAVP